MNEKQREKERKGEGDDFLEESRYLKRLVMFSLLFFLSFFVFNLSSLFVSEQVIYSHSNSKDTDGHTVKIPSICALSQQRSPSLEAIILTVFMELTTALVPGPVAK